MPAALYPPNTKLIQASKRNPSAAPVEEIAEYLLCGTCEGLFNRNGESYALRWIAPKIVKSKEREIPLLTLIDAATPFHTFDDVGHFRSADLNLDMDQFAYFAVSVVWRASARVWRLTGGRPSERIDLSGYATALRQYLLGRSLLPQTVAVTATVCTDRFSRERWFTPTESRDYGCRSFPLLTFGVGFRTWIGHNIPGKIRDACCIRSADRPILRTHCDDQTARVMD